MKRNLLSFLALVVAIAFSSYTVKQSDMYFLEYKDLGGAHNVKASYFAEDLSEPTEDTGTDELYWISIEDIDDSEVIEQDEFAAAFEALDEVDENENDLNDDIEKVRTFTVS